MLHEQNYNPDVLTCIANLSNDEVFTPPKMANAVLDLLPKELWSNPETTFLDPFTKSGIFLREIAQRLNTGLKDIIPDEQERINHIMTRQVFGISITELTSLLSRRSLYCSKTANSKYAVTTAFNDADGHIKFDRIEHTWKGGKCTFCGASKETYARSDTLESHAYQFIHTETPEEIFKMKFDVIVGNPPYQLDTGGSGRQAKPIYNLFVEQAKKLRPRYLAMIIPSRWFSGGMGLHSFRRSMLQDKRISHLVDYTNSKDCFDGVSISGGVNYFLWQSDYAGLCNFSNIHNGLKITHKRDLSEFPILVRYNESIDIIHKVKKNNKRNLSEIVSPINVFGFSSSDRGDKKEKVNSLILHHSKGKGFVDTSDVLIKKNANKHKVIVSRTISEHAGEPGKDGKFKVLARTMCLPPGEICTHSYLVIGTFDNIEESISLERYLRTKFVRFFILQAISGIDLSKERFMFVPIQDFTQDWTDEKLYKKYDLNKEEITFIESMIRAMD